MKKVLKTFEVDPGIFRRNLSTFSIYCNMLCFQKYSNHVEDPLKNCNEFLSLLLHDSMASGFNKAFLEVKTFEILITKECGGGRKKKVYLSYHEE
jgi:hypothetical protein